MNSNGMEESKDQTPKVHLGITEDAVMNSSLDYVTGTRDKEIVAFNVGGVRLETLKSTLIGSQVTTNLANEDFLRKFYQPEKGEYFFDRDPEMFKATLNYLRTGDLHLPSFICGPAAKTELEYWGVAQHKIEQCCWINYNEWNSTQEALKRLEHDRKVTLATRDTSRDPHLSCWQRWRPVVWQFLNRTNSSRGAKIFGYLSLLFVVMSIFSFLAETTEPFAHYVIKDETSSVAVTPATDFGEGGGLELGENVALHSLNNTTNQTSTNNLTTLLTNLKTTAATLTSTTSATSNNTNVNGTVQNATDTPLNVNGTTTPENVTKIKSKHPTLAVIDMICLSYFIVEYVTRFIFSPKKLKHATSLLAVIDFLAILPDCIEFTVYHLRPELREDVNAVSYITIIRVIRVLRIFRLVRHSAGLWILIYTLKASFSELMLLVWFMMIGILLFASLIYYVDDKKTFSSIPHGFWWALITMTTVGYGDMYPVTVLGKIVGSMCAMAGVLMIGFTVPSLVNNFMLYYRHIQFAMHVEEFEKELKRTEAESAKGTVPGNGTNMVPGLYCGPNGDSKQSELNKHELYPLVGEKNC